MLLLTPGRRMFNYDWPEAYEMAIVAVLGRCHCGVSDCCGELSPDQEQQIFDMAMDLVGETHDQTR